MSAESMRIGRYELVGQLAMGGMAEIQLGRLLGPSGFERVVVVKRILPHLSQHVAFREMFLDEARIAAAIHHPNVVQVHELGQENEELFLVMEYLQGESLHGLLRRLMIVGEPLDPALVAYIGAQACAGLHAAHELRSADGRLVELVHRDISPQNVFITYDGAVKILDFGIAKAADRITQTEAGMLKGKFSYMSPEQCLGEPPDRRSDIFSLGVVLYEAATGRRLFHRGSQLNTLRAVIEDPFPPPSELRPELSAALEGVILTALARDRDDRFATTAAMRRALAEAASGLDGPTVPEEALAELMQRLFPDRIEEKSAMLQNVRSGSSLTDIPAADTDVDVELPSIVFSPADEPGSATPPTSVAVPALMRRGRSKGRAWTLGGAMIALAAAGVAWTSLDGLQDPASAARAPHENGQISVASESHATAPGDRAPGDRAPGDRAPAPTRPEPAPEDAPRAPEPASVTLRVVSTPSGAEVTLAGEPRGRTPLELELPRAEEPLDLRVVRGELEHTAQIVPDRDRHVQLILAHPSAGRRRPPARPRPPAPRPPREPAPRPAAEPTDDFARFD